MKIVVSLILFIIPFFWLKPGEMDLGGDNSRLYFYDPISYLFSQTLYSIVSSGVGGEAISYWALPFILLLAIFKSIFNSPTILISAFHGMSLSVAFISCYWIVKELVSKENALKKDILEYSAILAGLFYVFSPFSIFGWDKVLLTHNQIFLNPLIFFLLLRFFLTDDIRYLLGLLLVTLIFSPNFAYVAAPAFFAFYPLSFIFLFFYTKYIRKCAIPVKGLFVGGVLFILLQAFHLMPHVITLFSPGSGAYEAVFSSESKFSRGLSYFSAIAPNIKVSISFMSLPQMTELGFLSFVFIVFPAIVIIGFLLNKGKTYLLTGIFFLIAFFSATANISNIGLNFYKSLFNLPGFSMFRNFYGQWGFVFLFFYTLLLGQSLFVVLSKIKKHQAYFLAIIVAMLLIVNAWPFINGTLINKVLHQSKDVKIAIRMDPEYEKVLSFIRTLPVDGKVLTLPLNDPGYQILAGKDGGAYQGPSTISYLTGKNDFSGYNGLVPFAEFFLRWVKEKNYPALQRLFSILNIRYIFYNSDPYIYDETFPKFPYNYVRDFLPKDQKSYKEFVGQLPIYKIKDFGDKYHIYSIKDDLYLPHIYVALETVYSSNPLIPYATLNTGEDLRSVVLDVKDVKKGDNLLLKADNKNPLIELVNNYHLHRHEPFISRRLDDFFYPSVLLREKFELWKARKNRDQYLDFSLFYLSKRILELDRFQEGIPIVRDKWEESGYNSWEASLARYEQAMEQLIEWIAKSPMPESWQKAGRIKINEQLYQHETRLVGVIKNIKMEEDDKTYLRSLADRTFARLFNKLNLETSDPFAVDYSLTMPENQSGEYEVYLKKGDEIYTDLSKVQIEMSGKILKPIEISQGGSLVRLDNVDIKGRNLDFILRLLSTNLVEDSVWQGSGIVKDTTLTISNPLDNNSGGLIKEIRGVRSNKQYFISFDYSTYGDDFIFKFYDKRAAKKQKKSTNAYFEKNLNSADWKKHQSVLTSHPETTSAFIQILSNNEKDQSSIAIKNIQVVEVPNPTIIFKKVLPEDRTKVSIPRIIFTKINPTRYKVKVTEATGLYTLVFLESFNKDWKLYLADSNNETRSLRGWVSRLFATGGRKLVTLFGKNSQKNTEDQRTVVDHFFGDIGEGPHKNIFLNLETFDTWGREDIAEDTHFLANGYANAWYIEPDDVRRKTNYELIIEFTRQKSFYGGLATTFFTALAVMGFLTFLIFKERRHEK